MLIPIDGNPRFDSAANMDCKGSQVGQKMLLRLDSLWEAVVHSLLSVFVCRRRLTREHQTTPSNHHLLFNHDAPFRTFGQSF